MKEQENKNTLFGIYRRRTGGEYLVERKRLAAGEPRYRWEKKIVNPIVYADRKSAERTARKYGGRVVEII